ncbi:hairy/enhancer-of-split related with YRPW motif protein-like [Hemicordylus capensis]|uniref:hairy/enhancer-of-split related with YRPW motif protein-like n=1 Tax=Hemicordylus capensis TaxID=884348 RepID=UPI0023029587|nr:hairy/enhancer-of-split related with YRPW motif protein-like [Hemicordylus capensis]
MAPSSSCLGHVQEERLLAKEKNKLRKPVVEKMRRDRINSSIEQLKILLEKEFQRQQPNAKLEKADILEVAVGYLKQQHQVQSQALSQKDPELDFNSGYLCCLREVLHFLSFCEPKRETQAHLIKNFCKVHLIANHARPPALCPPPKKHAAQKNPLPPVAIWRPWYVRFCTSHLWSQTSAPAGIMAPSVQALSLESQASKEKNRLRKPMVEKLRRDRINSSIEQLKLLLEKEFQRHQPNSKLEKADVLEMTVSYLKFSQTMATSSASITQDYSQGYSSCLKETLQFLAVHSANTDTQAKLLSHFQKPWAAVSKDLHSPSPASLLQKAAAKKAPSKSACKLWRPW